MLVYASNLMLTYASMLAYYRSLREDVLNRSKLNICFLCKCLVVLKLLVGEIILIDAETDGEQCDTFFV